MNIKFVVCACATVAWLVVMAMIATLALESMNGSTLGVAVGATVLLWVIGTAAFTIPKAYRILRGAWGQALIVLVIGQLFGCGCERVNAGYVGVKVEMAGSNRGVQSAPMVTGYVFYNPLTTKVFEYPTFVQTAVWKNNGADGNDEISFNSKDGLGIAADVSISYQIDGNAVPAFYVKFRNDDLSLFTHGYMRNVVRDQCNEVASTMAVEELYGPRKEEFLRAVRERINSELKPIGVRVDQFGFIGAPRPPQNVINAINAKIAATQQAMQVENEVRATQAQALKNVAQAKGEADALVAKAAGQAAAKVAVAEAEAKANAALANSITPQLLQWRTLDVQLAAINRWNGQRPQVEGQGQGLLLQVK